MTPFEIIVLVLIYLFCYGYALEMLKLSNEGCADVVFHVIGSCIIAFYVPIIIGAEIANKLNN
jgi:hypothetical protein